LSDPDSIGRVRECPVSIGNSQYLPLQMPALLQEMLDRVITTAQCIRHPIEAAFFLWMHLAYLQPYEDGNKRVSRLAANIPLMLYNQAPLSFLDVDRLDYAYAMLGFYEYGDLSIAIDLFSWSYRRSQLRYRGILERTDLPDPFRMQYRVLLAEAVQQVVRCHRTEAQALLDVNVPAEDLPRFELLLHDALNKLAVHNYSRFTLRESEVLSWIEAGRPR
ncbi:MAG: Fic family protein, partial [Burkholderiaceae bacterium]